MNQESQILKKADNFVFELFKTSNTENLLYHNYKHTYDVVTACNEIAKGSELNNSDLELILLSAWFHDVGYLESCENHEELSVKVATEFLTKESYNEDKIAQITACILATKMEKKPTTLLEEIICDADMKGLSSPIYSERTNLLREECVLLKGVSMTEAEWLEKEVEFLTAHRYYTKYAQLNFNENKVKNLVSVQAGLKKFSKKVSEQGQKSRLKKEELKLKVKKAEIPEKGIETMFRTALKNHMELSAIADNKANTMLSINALVLSIIMSSLFSKFDKHPELMLPTIFMLIICLATIVVATLSTKPKITGGKFSTDDVKKRKTNLLFFGNFHKMELTDYEWGMKEMMKDKEYLYSSLTRDLYSLGVVLARKYIYLRWCYLIFMYGMIVSVLLFGAANYLGH